MITVLYIWRGGLVFHGGFIGGMAAAIVVSLAKKRSILKQLDAALPYISLGYDAGRIGCLLNGCCAGAETSLPWGSPTPS